LNVSLRGGRAVADGAGIRWRGSAKWPKVIIPPHATPANMSARHSFGVVIILKTTPPQKHPKKPLPITTFFVILSAVNGQPLTPVGHHHARRRNRIQQP